MDYYGDPVEDARIVETYRKASILCEDGAWAALDMWIVTTDIQDEYQSVLLAMLTATNPPDIKRRLPSRPQFYNRVKERLGGSENSLLAGLE